MVAAIRPVLVGVLGLAALSGCDVRPTQRSLVDAETVMTLRSDVAETRLSLAAASGEVGSVGVESHLAPPGQESLFRQAEVAPSKVAETRALLSDLGAQEGVDRSIRFNLPADILFDFDKATLRTDTSAALEKTARLVMNYPNAPLLVAGHTDAKGDDAYNIALSKRRADTVAKWLTAKTGRGVKTQGIGESQPVASNARADGSDDPDGRQRNRRVEVIMLPSPI
ncbi:OmpA family protein [Sphingopyxis sp.]|uniref:OmpA family protein n=1 Tax=Sphingopyxis sp. TaxID=1908224 RepID=UPI003D1102A9